MNMKELESLKLIPEVTEFWTYFPNIARRSFDFISVKYKGHITTSNIVTVIGVFDGELKEMDVHVSDIDISKNRVVRNYIQERHGLIQKCESEIDIMRRALQEEA